ncbi:MAG: peptidoglycan-binding domain-containing protein [Roseburia inulinivorans]
MGQSKFCATVWKQHVYINTAEKYPASGLVEVDLTIGSTGEKVRQIQEELARISRSYPAIPTVTPDGIYGPATREAVEVFQRVFGLPVTGVIDFTVPGIKFLKFVWQYVAHHGTGLNANGGSHCNTLCGFPIFYARMRSFSPFRTLFHISFYFASLIPPSLPYIDFLAYHVSPCRKKHNKQ